MKCKSKVSLSPLDDNIAAITQLYVSIFHRSFNSSSSFFNELIFMKHECEFNGFNDASIHRKFIKTFLSHYNF